MQGVEAQRLEARERKEKWEAEELKVFALARANQTGAVGCVFVVNSLLCRVFIFFCGRFRGICTDVQSGCWCYTWSVFVHRLPVYSSRV